MIKIVLNDILVNLKKNWIVYYFLWFTLSLLVYFTNISYSLNSVTFKKGIEDIGRVVLNEDIFKAVIPLINGISMSFIFSITNKIPLRLSKGMFVCYTQERKNEIYIFTISSKNYI